MTVELIEEFARRSRRSDQNEIRSRWKCPHTVTLLKLSKHTLTLSNQSLNTAIQDAAIFNNGFDGGERENVHVVRQFRFVHLARNFRMRHHVTETQSSHRHCFGKCSQNYKIPMFRQ